MAVSIDAIFLNPHARIRRSYNKENPRWQPKDLRIYPLETGEKGYSPKSTDCTPACLSLDDPTIRVTLSLGPEFSGKNLVLSGFQFGNVSPDDYVNVFTSQSTNCPDGQLKVDFHVKIATQARDVPWGIQGTISWCLQVIDGVEIQPFAFSSLWMELYFIVDDLPDYYRDEAINLEFLRELLLPCITYRIRSRESWIEHAVRLCHASDSDKVATRDLRGYAMHNYRYDAHGGSAYFSSLGHGFRFNMDSWESNRHNYDHNSLHNYLAVNCYDQAALLCLALSLGIPAMFRDAKNQPIPDPAGSGEMLQNIGILYKEPFGCIQTTDLIGWGNVNNPFFYDDETAMNLTSEEVEQRTAMKDRGPLELRNGFGNHKWAYVRVPGPQKNYWGPEALYALDACAGPHASLEPYDQYIATAVDSVASVEYYDKWFRQKNRKRISDDVLLKTMDFGTSLTTCDVKPAIIAIKRKPFTEADWAKHHLSAVYEKYASLLDPSQKRPLVSLAQKAPIARIFEQIRDMVPAMKTRSGQISGQIEFKEHDLEVGAEGTKVIMDIWSEKMSPQQPFVTIQIDIAKDFQSTVHALLDEINSYDSDHAFELLTDDTQRAGAIQIIGQKDKDGKEHGPNMFVYGNLAIFIEGSLNVADSREMSRRIGGLLEQHEVQEVPQIDVSAVEVSGYENIVYNKPFQMSILIPGTGAKEIDIAFENKDLVLVQDVYQPDPRDHPSMWYAMCVVQRPEATRDTMHIVIAELNTYAVSVKKVDIFMN